MTPFPELKPCPVCGGAARLMVRKGVTGTACKSRYWRGYAHCKSKRCGFSGSLAKSPEKAVAAWNTRPREDETRESLRQYLLSRPPVTDDRDTYADGFTMGIVEVISRLDRASKGIDLV